MFDENVKYLPPLFLDLWLNFKNGFYEYLNQFLSFLLNFEYIFQSIGKSIQNGEKLCVLRTN